MRLGCGALAGTMGQVRCGGVLAAVVRSLLAPRMDSTAPSGPHLLATLNPSPS